MNRRDLLRSSLAAGSGVLFGRYTPAAAADRRPLAPVDPIPARGAEWNESVVFPDEATARFTRRLTTRRTFNHKPTYHINQGFSPDNRFLVFCTYHSDGASALVRADVETGDLKVIDRAEAGDSFKFTGGNSITLIPKVPLVAYAQGPEIRIYDLRTLERVMVFQPPRGSDYTYSHPAGTADGKTLVVARNDVRYNRSDPSVDPNSVLGVTFLTVDLSSGKWTEIFRDEKHRSDHVIPSPVDPDLVIVDRDSPPKFSSPNCAAPDPRNWVLDLRTGKAVPIRPRNGCNFTWHSNWSYTGEHVYYHGPSASSTPRWLAERYPNGYPAPYKGKAGAAHFIGVATAAGETVWEKEFPFVYYGHSSSHATKDVIILDNVLTQDLFTALYWRELDSRGIPRMELLGRHNSDYASGQQSHPHSQMSSDGKWLSYNSGHGGRTDVYALQVT